MQYISESNTGAALVRRGAFVAALAHFQRALAGIQTSIEEGQAPLRNQSHDGGIEQGGDLITPVSPISTFRDSLLAQRSTMTQDPTMQILEDDFATVWAEPFVFSDDVTQDGRQHCCCLHITAAACTTFNTALVFHMLAVGTSGTLTADALRSAIHYRKAVALYSRCKFLLPVLSVGGYERREEGLHWTIFKIAVLNNLAHCYAQLSYTEAKENALQSLRNILVTIVYEWRSRPASIALQEGEAELLETASILLQTTLRLARRGCSPAPAA
mmetsp:Transcript_134283/g.388725  ORF Transcript_134283/g.388725 Transcript_134283/m.388725 type:complete len:271 (-) Transcript_134283:190-1002(-)